MTAPKYAKGDVLMMRESVVVIDAVTVNETRGPIYSVEYLSKNGKPTEPMMRGGASFWWNESEFTQVTEPVLRLRVELTRRSHDASDAKARLKEARADVRRLVYAIEIATAAKGGAR